MIYAAVNPWTGTPGCGTMRLVDKLPEQPKPEERYLKRVRNWMKSHLGETRCAELNDEELVELYDKVK